jgi:methylated-DNA-[protein]-cysteine S-methyltransferase
MKLDCIPVSALKGRTATYATVTTPFGPALLATSNGALCWLDFKKAGRDVEALARYWRGGNVQPHPGSLQEMADALFAGRHHDLTVLVAGTPFQHSVWQALARIAAGETISYGELARRIGKPAASRAVGGAVGANPVVYVLPCHRVLAGDGSLHGFGCGLPLKEELLRAEGVMRRAA